LTRSLKALASACVENVTVPDGPACCGAAGDRIFLHPELPRSACAALKGSLSADCREGYSSSRTCEIGMTRFSGLTYRSILYLLLEAVDDRHPSGKRRGINLEPQLEKKEAS
jgi:D-lactate dehydrogenase